MKTQKVSEVAPEFTAVSSKGQVVIPQDLREKLHVKKGSVFAISSPKKDMLVLKKVKSRMGKEDMELLESIRKAWEEIERGKYRAMSKEEFFKEFREW